MWAISTSLVIALPAEAKLGASEAQLVRLYGKVRSRSDEIVEARGQEQVVGTNHYFLKDQWIIVAFVSRGGACHRVTYRKAGEWTEAEIQEWLEFNPRRHATWEELPARNPARRRQWKAVGLSGRPAEAEWTPEGGLVLKMPDFDGELERVRRALKKRPAKSKGN